MIGDELDVLGHEIRVHADEGAGERVADKLLLDLDSLLDDLPDDGLVGLLVDVRVEEARKVAVKALVAADELVGEGEAGHEAALLQPVDGAEGAGEEDALDARERDQALGERLGAVG